MLCGISMERESISRTESFANPKSGVSSIDNGTPGRFIKNSNASASLKKELVQDPKYLIALVRNSKLAWTEVP
jgi:hypothetical protein